MFIAGIGVADGNHIRNRQGAKLICAGAVVGVEHPVDVLQVIAVYDSFEDLIIALRMDRFAVSVDELQRLKAHTILVAAHVDLIQFYEHTSNLSFSSCDRSAEKNSLLRIRFPAACHCSSIEKRTDKS